jgi:hypothetical protein
MKSLRCYEQLLITAVLVTLLSLIGGCAPKVLVHPDLPPEQSAYIRGARGSFFVGGPELIAVDGKELIFANSAYILPGKHTIKVCFLNWMSRYTGGCELQFEAKPGHKYVIRCSRRSFFRDQFYFWVEDLQTQQVVSGEKPQ